MWDKECPLLVCPQDGFRETNTSLALEYYSVRYWNCDFKVSKILQYSKCSHNSEPTVSWEATEGNEHRPSIPLNVGKLRLTEQSDLWPMPAHQLHGRLLVSKEGRKKSFVVEQKHC